MMWMTSTYSSLSPSSATVWATRRRRCPPTRPMVCQPFATVYSILLAQGEGISERPRSGIEAEFMLFQIAFGLRGVPRKARWHAKNIITFSDIMQGVVKGRGHGLECAVATRMEGYLLPSEYGLCAEYEGVLDADVHACPPADIWSADRKRTSIG